MSQKLLIIAPFLVMFATAEASSNKGERHIIVPSKTGCYCVDAMFRMANDGVDRKLGAYRKCAQESGLPQDTNREIEFIKKELEKEERQIMEQQVKCGRLVLDFSPDNVTQECFERANTWYKMHLMLVKFLAEMGDKRTAYMKCYTKEMGYVLTDGSGKIIGANTTLFEAEVDTYFAAEIRDSIKQQYKACGEKEGTFKDGKSVDLEFEDYIGCLIDTCT